MAGTNDIVFDIDVSNAPRRLGSLIGEINAACPDATVLVGTLLPLIHPESNPQLSSKDTEAFNSAMQSVVQDLASKEKHVALIDMGRVTESHINKPNGIHPTDEGYNLIAAAWYDGLIAAGEKGWIQEPLPDSSQGLPSDSEDTSLVDDHIDGMKAVTAEQNTWKVEPLLLLVLVLAILMWMTRRGPIFNRRKFER